MNNINDGIPKDLCSLTYITVDTAIKHIITLGPGTLLAKLDIKSAFCLRPVHPGDRHLLAMRWNKQLYIDTCLPFGLRSALNFLISWQTYYLVFWTNKEYHQSCTIWTILLSWAKQISPHSMISLLPSNRLARIWAFHWHWRN